MHCVWLLNSRCEILKYFAQTSAGSPSRVIGSRARRTLISPLTVPNRRSFATIYCGNRLWNALSQGSANALYSEQLIFRACTKSSIFKHFKILKLNLSNLTTVGISYVHFKCHFMVFLYSLILIKNPIKNSLSYSYICLFYAVGHMTDVP